MTSTNKGKSEFPIDSDIDEALFASVKGVTPPVGLRAKVLERAHGQTGGKDLLTVRAKEGEWKSLAPGVEVKLLYIDEAAKTKSFLLRAEAGAEMPGHQHIGIEECLVLEGEFSLGDITLHAGDYHLAHAGAIHGPASTPTGTLVYLRAHIDQY
jgi:anti-sigma factor ChrR (cupin superfamily)